MKGKVLITGSNGQLGQCFKEVAKNNSNYIFTTREDFNIKDIEMMRKYLENSRDIKFIVNCAAYTNVKKAETSEFILAMLVNSEGPRNLAKICDEFGIYLVHIGTEYIMDIDSYKHNNIPLNENNFNEFVINRHKDKNYYGEWHNLDINNYGFSKSYGIYNMMKEFGDNENYVTIITSWLFSEFGENFVKTMYNRIKSGLDTEVVYTQVGSPTYAMDLARYIYDTIENNDGKFVEDGVHFINFSNLGTASWYDVAKMVDIFEKSNKIHPRNEPFDDIIRPIYSVLNLERIKNQCGNKKYIRHWVNALNDCLKEIKYKEKKNNKI